MKKILTTWLMLFLVHLSVLGEESIVVHNCLSGRTGDRIISFIGARWFAYKTHLPFFYKGFRYSNNLALSDIEKVFPPDLKKNYKSSKQISWHSLENFVPEQNTIYLWSKPASYSKENLKEMRSDPQFLSLARQLISHKDISTLDLIVPPPNVFSVAVHVRTGIGYDGIPSSEQFFNTEEIKKYKKVSKKGRPIDHRWPFKFPPKQYYVDQLKRLSQMKNHEKMYVFIFTDDPQTQVLTEKIKEAVNLPNLTFACRVSKENKAMDDFFSMGSFDALIRPGKSHFSEVIHLIGNFKIAIYPTSYRWVEDAEHKSYLIMEEIQTEEEGNNL